MYICIYIYACIYTYIFLSRSLPHATWDAHSSPYSSSTSRKPPGCIRSSSYHCFRVLGLGLRIWDLGFGFGVWGWGFAVRSLGFRAEGLRF